MSSDQGFGPPPQQQGYSATGSPQPVSPEQQFKPVFNQDELRVLRECNLESFYYRCVPMAAALTTAAYIAMKRGVLKVSDRFGYSPKMLGAAFIGYFAGKFSYQSACAEKLMRLPDSPVGEALRKRKGRMGFQESMNMEPGFSVAIPSNESGPTHPRQTIFDDHRPDLQSHNEGLEDYERGVTDSLTPYTEIIPSSSQQSTSYEEMRRQNREEHIHRMAEKYRKPLPDSSLDSHSNLPAEDSHGPPARPARIVKKNQYGDEVYE